MSAPALVIQDFGGHHNANLSQTRARLIRGASWKRQRIAVVIPAADMIPARVALALWNLAFPPNNAVIRILALGCEVGDAYSSAIEQVLAHPDLKDWEYILTVEHDNAPPQDGVIKLLEQLETHPEYAAISGLYWTKGEGGCAQCWGDPTDPILNFRPQVPVPNTLMHVNGIGMGFAVWRMSMFKDARLRKPWFKTIAGKEGVGTQDLYFAVDAVKYGYKFAVATTVLVGHIDSDGMVW